MEALHVGLCVLLTCLNYSLNFLTLPQQDVLTHTAPTLEAAISVSISGSSFGEWF